jgi:fucose permease
LGRISDATGGNIQAGYWVPVLCFAVILLFAIKQKKAKPSTYKVPDMEQRLPEPVN